MNGCVWIEGMARARHIYGRDFSFMAHGSFGKSKIP
jgi:hypothetical protein